MNKFFQINEQDLFQRNKVTKLTNDNLITESGNRKNLLYKFKNYLVNNSSVFIYFFISFIWVIQEISMAMLSEFLKDIDFWFLEILIVTIFFSKIFLVKVYKHQKLAIGINLIPSIFKIIAIIFRFKSKEEIVYTKYPWLVSIGLIGHIILISLNAFINCSIKFFIDLKYITISQLFIFYSFIGIIVCTIIDVIITFVPCSKNIDLNLKNQEICNVTYEGNLYFDNFRYYFYSFIDEYSFGKCIRAFSIIFDFTSFFLKSIFIYQSLNIWAQLMFFSHNQYFIFLKR